MLSRIKTWLSARRSPIVAFLAVALLLLVFWVFSIPCPIKYLTGISCAGCGMTRAWMSALRLDLAAAFGFHPLFWAVPVAGVFILLLGRFPRLSKGVFAVLLVLDIAVYLCRMLDPGCTVVQFEPTKGLIYRIIAFPFTFFGSN